MTAHFGRLRSRMASLDVDGLVATTIENIRYLTGISSVALEMFPHTGQCFAVVTRDRPDNPWFVSSRCEADQFLDAGPELAGVTAYGTFFREPAVEGVALTPAEERLRAVNGDGISPATAAEALVATVRAAGLAESRIGVDEDGLRPDVLEALRAALPRAAFLPAAGAIRQVRKVKTDAELELVARSAAVMETAIRATVSIARPGVTERQLVREFERTVAGAGGRSRFTLIKIGRSAVAGQSAPSDEPLRRGDAIWFDVGGTVDGYWSDIARVHCVGEPSPRLEKYYNAMLAGEDAALAAARPGMTGRELFEITVNAVRAAGVPHYRRQHVGHGIGVEVYDPVLITPDSEDVIEDGTVVNIETPYYEFGLGAVHVEDPFVVRAGGNALLTTLDRDLGVGEG
ncbi:Xaa-Pro aminopeptidase [Amycolatopsis arida]|uniref:Xaa-Pro aminopeptidase n=1 Tax=Amycolatopsis arida TaxID=587909 RepID=A0A1I6A8S1_9PSEU|nr:Xaa-Pro peptidase family protein [Amycolatopsis arida]TDX88516.1 Xaa-Pro aminopeptidase [Amycolatopsis arida]SFQ65023.1 Xaa-Pro aminopeptidase [Amycolatopsis arida]